MGVSYKHFPTVEIVYSYRKSGSLNESNGVMRILAGIWNRKLPFLRKHVPAKSVVARIRPELPWLDGECRDMKRFNRRLERRISSSA